MLRREPATVRPDDLKRLRIERGLVQLQVARLVGCSEATVGHAELGRRNLSLEAIIKFAEVLGCRPSDIADIHVTPEELAAIAEAVA